MGSLDFFLLRKGCDFLVVASLDFGIGRCFDDMLAEESVMQLAIADIGHALLEIFRLVDAFGKRAAGEKLDVDRTGKSRDLLLLVRQLGKLRVEVLHRKIEFRLGDRERADLGNNRIFLRECGSLERDRGDDGRRDEKFVTQHKLPFAWMPVSGFGSGLNPSQTPECGHSVSAATVDIIRTPSYLSRNLASRRVSGRYGTICRHGTNLFRPAIPWH
ncbi:hypothetical protein D3C72_296530 [compost metagenome]